MGVDKGYIHSRYCVVVPEFFRAYMGVESGGGYKYYDTYQYEMGMDNVKTIQERSIYVYEGIEEYCHMVNRFIQLFKICRKYEKALHYGENGEAESVLYYNWVRRDGVYNGRNSEYIGIDKDIIMYTDNSCDTLDLTKINMYLNKLITEGEKKAVKEIYVCD